MNVRVKGYFVPNGFMGLVGDSYMLFATESDYYELVDDILQEDNENE